MCTNQPPNGFLSPNGSKTSMKGTVRTILQKPCCATLCRTLTSSSIPTTELIPQTSKPRQVSLYLLLMEERYSRPMTHGLLWNVHSPSMAAVAHAHNEIASILMHRNRLAVHLVGNVPQAPPPLTGGEAERMCARCSMAPVCAAHHKVCMDKRLRCMFTLHQRWREDTPMC